jgi:hypothetical protein
VGAPELHDDFGGIAGARARDEPRPVERRGLPGIARGRTRTATERESVGTGECSGIGRGVGPSLQDRGGADSRDTETQYE